MVRADTDNVHQSAPMIPKLLEKARSLDDKSMFSVAWASRGNGLIKGGSSASGFKEGLTGFGGILGFSLLARIVLDVSISGLSIRGLILVVEAVLAVEFVLFPCFWKSGLACLRIRCLTNRELRISTPRFIVFVLRHLSAVLGRVPVEWWRRGASEQSIGWNRSDKHNNISKTGRDTERSFGSLRDCRVFF